MWCKCEIKKVMSLLLGFWPSFKRMHHFLCIVKIKKKCRHLSAIITCCSKQLHDGFAWYQCSVFHRFVNKKSQHDTLSLPRFLTVLKELGVLLIKLLRKSCIKIMEHSDLWSDTYLVTRINIIFSAPVAKRKDFLFTKHIFLFFY